MNFEKLHNFLDSEIPCSTVPGGLIYVYHKGQLVYSETFGYGDYLHTKPIDPNDHYILYSCSKVVTSSAVMHLVEEGKLDLDDPVSKYLPAFASVTLPDGSKPQNPITIRHLFTMTAGLNYTLNTPYICELLRKKPNATTVEIAQAIAQAPLDFEPGTKYQYSLCHDVLAAVAEVVTGMNFEEYVRSWAFEPLGLTEVAYNFNDNNRSKLAPQYQQDENSETIRRIGAENIYIFSPNHYSGGAGMIARPSDYAAILNAICTGKLLKKETLAMMKTNQLCPQALANFREHPCMVAYGYGLGVRTLMCQNIVNYKAPLGEFGWDGAAGSYAMLDDEREIAITYVQGVKHCSLAYNYLHPHIRDLVYEALGYSF